MLMVIVGAGASHDSVKRSNRSRDDTDEYMPPLADGLFALRENFRLALLENEHCAALVGQLRGAIQRGVSVEAELERVKQEASRFSWKHRALAAVQFYLREILWDCGHEWYGAGGAVTNYAVLLDLLLQWRAQYEPQEPVLLVTFNYDTMLDVACRAQGMDINALDGYIASSSPFALFKPHGSVNWFRDTGAEVSSGSYRDVARNLIERAPIQLTTRFRVLEGREPTLTFVASTDSSHQYVGLYPAIAIPVERKDASVFAFPNEHEQRLRDSIARVTRLLVIGWRGMEEHFLELWKPKRAVLESIVVVAKKLDSARETLERLEAANIHHNVTKRIPIDGGFSRLADREELQTLIGPY